MARFGSIMAPLIISLVRDSVENFLDLSNNFNQIKRMKFTKDFRFWFLVYI